MDWLQVLSLFMANAGLIFWFRAEARADWRHLDAKIDAIQKESQAFQASMLKAMQDFHGRLCSIEERRKRDRD